MTERLILDRDEEFRGTIRALYLEELGREPDPGGLQSFLNFARNGGTGAQIRRALHDSLEGIAFRAKPKPLPLPHLEVRGNDFVDINGARIVLNGTDQYCAFRQYRDDGPDALRAAIEESHEFGFVLWRVFMQGSMAQNNALELRPTETGYYDDVRPFVDHLNANGIVPLLTIGVDNQDVRSPMAHWIRMDQLTNGAWRILSYFNEWSKNISDFKPEDIPPSSGLWSRGSDTSDVRPRAPAGPVLEFHPVRNYQTAMRDAVASPIELFEVQGYRGALVIDEPGRMGTNAHDSRFIEPKAVQAYARLLSTLCGGVCFHNFFGQRGLLMDGPTRACAAAWSKGMTWVN